MFSLIEVCSSRGRSVAVSAIDVSFALLEIDAEREQKGCLAQSDGTLFSYPP
jgi:hypothetical protein